MKKAKKKGTPSAKTLRGLRSAPSQKPLRLKVGGFYETRCYGFIANILAYDKGRTFPFLGQWVGRSPYDDDRVTTATIPTFRPGGGIFFKGAAPRDCDLIREVPPPKSPKGRGK